MESKRGGLRSRWRSYYGELLLCRMNDRICRECCRDVEPPQEPGPGLISKRAKSSRDQFAFPSKVEGGIKFPESGISRGLKG